MCFLLSMYVLYGQSVKSATKNPAVNRVVVFLQQIWHSGILTTLVQKQQIPETYLCFDHIINAYTAIVLVYNTEINPNDPNTNCQQRGSGPTTTWQH